jgi:hypothetical protein
MTVEIQALTKRLLMAVLRFFEDILADFAPKVTETAEKVKKFY